MRLLFGLALVDSSLVVSGAALQAAGHRPLAPAFGRSRLRPATLSVVDIYSVADEWVRAAPYQSAFCITAFKATIADCITQARELAAIEAEPEAGIVSCDDVSCEVLEPSERRGYSWQRSLAFLLYGGLYQGCTQYYLFNDRYPLWFGEGDDPATVAVKVVFDQLVLTPLLCLPVLYLVKAAVLRRPLREGLRRYVEDARRDLLLKYWALWTPVQCLTFGVVPPQWRVPFIALVSFFWLLVLSSISSRGDLAAPPAPAADPQTTRTMGGE